MAAMWQYGPRGRFNLLEGLPCSFKFVREKSGLRSSTDVRPPDRTASQTAAKIVRQTQIDRRTMMKQVRTALSAAAVSLLLLAALPSAEGFR